MMISMTTITRTDLAIDLVDRMNKALRLSGIGVAELAEDMGVNRNTVGNWLAGRIEPKRASVRLFADLTNVTVEWLEFGIVPSDEELSRLSESNRRPSHYKYVGSDSPAYCSVADDVWPIQGHRCSEGRHSECFYVGCECDCHGAQNVAQDLEQLFCTADLALAA